MHDEVGTTCAEQQPRPLSNPLVFGNYDVAYVSAGTQQYGARACVHARQSSLELTALSTYQVETMCGRREQLREASSVGGWDVPCSELQPCVRAFWGPTL